MAALDARTRFSRGADAVALRPPARRRPRPRPGPEIAGGGAELPASAPPNPAPLPRSSPRSRRSRRRPPSRSPRPSTESSSQPEPAPLEVRGPRRLGDDHPRRWVNLDQTSGHANVRKKTRVKDDTAFALASVSKTYTSALIMALANEGKLDLDARVSTILPKVRIAGKATHPPAARPHERAARLLPQRQDRPGAAPRPRPQNGRRRTRSATSASRSFPPGRGGITRTRTTRCSRSSPKRSTTDR